jgi:hypothetical protein
MPEGHAIAAFTQARAIAVPACLNPIKLGSLEELAALRQVEARALMNVNGAG